MDDKFKDKIEKLARDSDTIITNPNDLKKLEDQGFKFQIIGSKSIEDTFNERLSQAQKLIKKLPELPETLPPAIKYLYQEIRECMLFGLNGAAITLIGILIEFTLKHVTYIKEIGGYQKYNPTKWDEFEKITLGTIIDRAKKEGIIISEQAEQLHSFREDIRNPYSHYNIKKITEDVIAGNVQRININTEEVEEMDSPAVENPMIQAKVKPWVDQEQVLYIFIFGDDVIKFLLNSLDKYLISLKDEQK